MGEEAGEEGSCAGEGGADDGDVAFHGGPGCCADVVVWIGFIFVRMVVSGLGGLGSVRMSAVRKTHRLDRLSWR